MALHTRQGLSSPIGKYEWYISGLTFLNQATFLSIQNVKDIIRVFAQNHLNLRSIQT